MKMQLNRYLAVCGVASRRKANAVIKQGRVYVNGRRVETLGLVVNPESDTITLDGTVLSLPKAYRYILLNKPAGVITSASDSRGRITVLDLVDVEERIFPVGRLDFDTEGVLLLTNDGDLAHRLMHPRFKMEKVYEAWVYGHVAADTLRLLSEGILIGPGVNVNGEVRVLEEKEDRSQVEIKIHEGKKRQIRRMMKSVGHPVVRLNRTCFAGLTANGVMPGEWRELTPLEVCTLYRETGLNGDDAAAGQG